jgi:hypothetical protein
MQLGAGSVKVWVRPVHDCSPNHTVSSKILLPRCRFRRIRKMSCASVPAAIVDRRFLGSAAKKLAALEMSGFPLIIMTQRLKT